MKRTEDFEEADEISVEELSDMLSDIKITNVELGRELDITWGPSVQQIVLHTEAGSIVISPCRGKETTTGQERNVLYFCKLYEQPEPTDDQIYNGHGREGGIFYG